MTNIRCEYTVPKTSSSFRYKIKSFAWRKSTALYTTKLLHLWKNMKKIPHGTKYISPMFFHIWKKCIIPLYTIIIKKQTTQRPKSCEYISNFVLIQKSNSLSSLNCPSCSYFPYNSLNFGWIWGKISSWSTQVAMARNSLQTKFATEALERQWCGPLESPISLQVQP